jgi:hypothetical protein
MPSLINLAAEQSSINGASLQIHSNNTSSQSLADILSPLNSNERPSSRTPPPTLPVSDPSESTMHLTSSPNNSGAIISSTYQHRDHNSNSNQNGWTNSERPLFMTSIEVGRLVNSSDELLSPIHPHSIMEQTGFERDSLASTLDDYFSQDESDAEVAVATMQSFSSCVVFPINTLVKPTPPDLPVPEEERLRRVRSLRNARTANHITEFIRILVAVLEEDVEGYTALNRPEPKTFPVTVHRGHTVEELTRMIEAEHAFLYGEPAPPPIPMKLPMRRDDSRSNVSLSPNSAGSLDTSNGRRPSYSQPSNPSHPTGYRPLVCSQLFVGMVPLRYDDFVGEVLDMNDVVRVINIYEDDVTGSAPNNSPIFSAASTETSCATSPRSFNSRSKSEFDSSTSQPSHKAESNENLTTRSCRPQVGGLEDRFRQCIYNEFSLAAFQAHCAREFTLESLLFFLEVEVFRELASGDQSKLPQGMRIEQYARYIYEIYIDNDAPLQVNLSEEIREEVANAGRCSASLFDGAQDMVHAMLKRHSFVRFEASDAHMLLARLRQQG